MPKRRRHPKPKKLKDPWGRGWTNIVRLDARELRQIDIRATRRVG